MYLWINCVIMLIEWEFFHVSFPYVFSQVSRRSHCRYLLKNPTKSFDRWHIVENRSQVERGF